MTLEERVLARTATVFLTGRLDTPCWVWQGSTSNGYGTIQAGRKSAAGHRCPDYVHVLMYERLVAPVELGKELDHLCRVRACWNPQHLEQVTHPVNVARGVSIAADYAVRDECGRGHPKTEENRYYRPDGKGWMCAPCQRLRSSKHYREMNAAKAGKLGADPVMA